MLTIDGVVVKNGMAFLAKDGKRQKFVIGTVHRDGTVTYLPEKNLSRYNYALPVAKTKLGATKVSNEEFSEKVFKKWIRSQREINEANTQKRRDAFASFEKMADDYKEAVKMDIIFDAANGAPVDEVLKRMNALIEEEKDISRDEGFSDGREEGYRDGLSEGQSNYSVAIDRSDAETFYRY